MKTGRLVAKGLTALLLASAATIGANSILEKGVQSRRNSTISPPPASIKIEQPTQKPSIKPGIAPAPLYRGLDKNECAAYAVSVAREMGETFKFGDAWNLRYGPNSRIVSQVRDNNQFKELIENGKVTPGMIVGVYNPSSSYLSERDQTGKQVKYTHVAVFAGVDPKKGPIFYHQLGRKIESITLDNLTKGLSSIREILDSKEA